MKKLLSFFLTVILVLSFMEIQPFALNTELLSNNGFENRKLDPFFSYAGDSEYEIKYDYRHSGSYGLYIKNRKHKYATYACDVLPLLKENGSGIYESSVWVKLKDASQVKATCQLVLNFFHKNGTNTYFTSPLAELTTSWQKFTFQGFIGVTDDIQKVLLYQQSFLNETAPDVYVDDFSLIKKQEVEINEEVITAERSDVTSIGAIRWDAWYTHDGVTNSVISQVERSLSPSQFHFRAPFFAEVTDDDKIIVPEFNQAIFDREMEYAKYAGIDYFAYVWYNSDMKAARKFHETSVYRNDVKMCACFDGNAINKAFAREEMATLLKEDYYMTVLDDRPLMYYFASSGNISNILNDIIYYEQLAEEIGVNKPFAVILNVNATAAKSAYGSAVSNYAISGAGTFQELAQAATNKALSYHNSKFQYVPSVTFGWHPEPRYINPVTWTSVGNNSWAEYATDTELLDHLAYTLSYMQHDSVKEYTMANTVLAYAWNEHDEGGWICPTLEVDENGRQLYDPDGTKKINENRINAAKLAIDFIKSGRTVSVTVDNKHNGSNIQKASDTISDLQNKLNANIYEGKPYYFSLGEIKGADLDIGSSLTLNYYVDTREDLTMRFTSLGNSIETKGVYDNKTGLYRFSYGVNPQCMGNNIKAELLYNGGVIDEKTHYSIRAYCEEIISSMDTLDYTEAQRSALKTLLANMLIYGSEAQRYTGSIAFLPYWTETYKKDYILPQGTRAVTGNESLNYRVISMGLSMESFNRIYYKLMLDDTNVTVTLNGKPVTLITDGDAYVVFSDPISATAFSEVYTLKIIKNNTLLTSVDYNVNAYMEAKLTDTKVGALVKALNNYGSAARAYISSLA